MKKSFNFASSYSCRFIMKLKYLLSILLLQLSALTSFSQEKEEAKKINVDREIKGIVIGGVNITQVDGDQVYGFHKVGANVGFGGILPLGHRFSLSVEVLYDEKGAFQKIPNSTADSGQQLPYYSLKWNYLTAPIMVHFEDRSTWTFGLGFSWGRMVSFKEKEWNIAQQWERPGTILYKSKNDFSVIADIRFRVWKHLKFNIRYSYSMAKIRSRYYDPDPGNVDPWMRNQYNNVITVRLLYYLNEKYLPERFKFTKKDKKKKTKNRE